MRRLTVKEEFIKITKGFTSAIILDYLVEFSKTISKENVCFNINLIEILKETMLDISEATLRRELKKLIKKGFLIELRQGKKYQYKINNLQIQEEFRKLGIIKEVENITEEKEFVDFNGKVYRQTKIDIKNVREKHEHKNTNIITYNNNTTIEEKSQDAYEEISEFIKRNLSYETFVTENEDKEEAEMFDKLYKIMLEVITSNSKTIRINKNEVVAEVVKSVFKKVDYSILSSVIFKLKRLNNKVINFKNYIITTIYNTYLEEDFHMQNSLYRHFGIA